MTSSAFSLGGVLPDGAFRLVQGEPKGVQPRPAVAAYRLAGSARSAACGSVPRRGPARWCATCEAAPWTTPRGCVGSEETSMPSVPASGTCSKRNFGAAGNPLRQTPVSSISASASAGAAGVIRQVFRYGRRQ
jgi:hypothetical protein